MKRIQILVVIFLCFPTFVFSEDIIMPEDSIQIEQNNSQIELNEVDIESESDTNSDASEENVLDNSSIIQLIDQHIADEKPRVSGVEKVVFPDRVSDPNNYFIAPEEVIKEGPVYYLVTFSEPVTGFNSMVVRLDNNTCPISPDSSICGEITTVEPLERVEDNEYYQDWVVTVDNIQNSGTFFLNFINHEEGVVDGISDYVVDEAGNFAESVAFNSSIKREYNVDTLPLEIDGAPYIDSSGIMHIPFNKNISNILFESDDYAQFRYRFSPTDANLTTTILPANVEIDGAELLITFPGAPTQSTHSLLEYFAEPGLVQIYSESGVATPSFSIETFINNTYIVCVNLANPDCSESKLIPSIPSVQFVDYIDDAGNIIFNRTYREGDEVLIRLTFSEQLYISPDFDAALELNTGPITFTGYALYDDVLSAGTSESNPSRITNALVLRYIVQPNDLSADLDAAIGLLEVWGGSGTDIDEQNGETHEIANYDLFIPAPRTLGSLSDKGEVVIDGVAVTDGDTVFIFTPTTVRDVTISNPLPLYKSGDSLQIEVTMSGPVNVNTEDGLPRIELNGVDSNGDFIIAVYSPELSDPDNGILIFEYIIQYGDSIPDLNYRFNNALQLNGATITQTVQIDELEIFVDASVSLPNVDGPYSLKGKYNIIIDALPPSPPDIDGGVNQITNIIFPEFMGTGEPNSTIIIFDEDQEVVCETQTAEDGNWSCESERGFAEGVYTLFIQQIDSNGNISEYNTEVEITIDLSSPENLNAADNQTIEPGAVTFVGTGDPGDTITIIIDEIEVCSVIIPESGDWECTTENEYPEGDYTAEIIEEDLAGNTTSIEITFTIQAPPDDSTDENEDDESTDNNGDDSSDDDDNDDSGDDNEDDESTDDNDDEDDKSTIRTSSSRGGGSRILVQQPIELITNTTEQITEEAPQLQCPVVKGYYDIGERGFEVLKIQQFLNNYEGENLELSGVYGFSTFKAVKRFQTKYAEDILSPWGLSKSEATGFWYLTTSKKANELVGCPTTKVVLPTGVIV